MVELDGYPANLDLALTLRICMMHTSCCLMAVQYGLLKSLISCGHCVAVEETLLLSQVISCSAMNIQEIFTLDSSLYHWSVSKPYQSKSANLREERRMAK